MLLQVGNNRSAFMQEWDDGLRLGLKAIETLWDGNVNSGAVAAVVLNKDFLQPVVAVSYREQDSGLWVHGEDHAIRKTKLLCGGIIPPGSILLTTLEPCHAFMADRASCSCSDLIVHNRFEHVYCGIEDWMQAEHSAHQHPYPISFSADPNIRERARWFLERIPPIRS